MKKEKDNIKIKSDWIEIRDNKGKLLRKKRINIHENDLTTEKESDVLLRKLGILSTKEIAEHNFSIVTKRKSKYEFDDLEK